MATIGEVQYEPRTAPSKLNIGSILPRHRRTSAAGRFLPLVCSKRHVADQRPRNELGSISAPTLSIAGELDRVTTVTDGQALARWHSRGAAGAGAGIGHLKHRGARAVTKIRRHFLK
jgi:pimeloyl-ACP methyl ester carboxylesterase